MNKYFQDFKNKALSWDNIEGAGELKREFGDFNKKVDFNLFKWRNALIRSLTGEKPYKFPAFSNLSNLPNELKEEEKRISDKLDLFIEKGKNLGLNEEKPLRFLNDLSLEEYNDLLEKAGFASYNDFIELRIAFKDINSIPSSFEITYGMYPEYRGNPLFGIYAMNNSYLDDKDQEYENILPNDPPLNDFWHKWVHYHLETLTKNEYQELISDIQMLKEYIKHIPQTEITYERKEYKKTTPLDVKLLHNL